MARGESKRKLPIVGAKRFGHRSHVGGNGRMKLDKDRLMDWADRMERKLKKKRDRNE